MTQRKENEMAANRMDRSAEPAPETRKAADTPVGRDVSKDAGLSEGTRQELELRGFAQSPFTGALLVGDGENYREVSAEEFEKVAKDAAKKAVEDSDKAEVKRL